MWVCGLHVSGGRLEWFEDGSKSASKNAKRIELKHVVCYFVALLHVQPQHWMVMDECAACDVCDAVMVHTDSFAQRQNQRYLRFSER